MKRLTLGVVAFMAAMAVPSIAAAGGGPPVVFTQTVTGTATLPFSACDGTPGVVTVSFHDTFHITEFADGRRSVSSNGQGTFFFVPDDGSPTSTGHYKMGFHVTDTLKTFVDHQVFVGAGVNANGDHFSFQIRFHVTFANGEVRVGVSSVECR